MPPVFLLFSIVVSLIHIICMRKKLLETSLKLDKDTFSPSDFCLMGMNMEYALNNYAPDKIEEEIKEVFKRKYGANVEYVNAAFDIEDFYALSEKFMMLSKLKNLVQSYCESNKFSLEKYQ